MARCSAYHTTVTIPKTRHTTRHGGRRGRGLGSDRNCALKICETSCTMPRALARLNRFRRYMRSHRPGVQLTRQAYRVPAEVSQEATRREGGLTMTSVKHLPNRHQLEMALLHSTIYPAYASPFPMGILVRGLVFNGNAMQV